MLQKRSLYWRESGHTEVVLWRVILQRSFYRGAHYNGGRVVMTCLM